MTIQIPLSRGGYALIDPEDEDLVHSYSSWWRICSPSPHRPSFYARGSVAGKRFLPLMHNLITGWAMVDHINGDGLDNRRENLRPATRSQNMANRRKITPGTSSRYKGVSLHTQLKLWVVYIGHEGRKIYVGLFRDEVEAALAYDNAARRLKDEYAALNFPKPGEQGACASDGATLVAT